MVMNNRIPLYRESLYEAQKGSEIDLWRNSHRANIECKKAIENAICSDFDGMHLKADAAQKVIGDYGYDRVNWVLANTVQHADWDGRYSRDNKEWAKGFFIQNNPARDNTLEFIANSHPAVLDGFINQARKQYDALGLFNFKHCIDGSRDMDYENHVLVLRADVLKEEYKSPENQLFYANVGGNGCSPTASGRKVFGVFLNDGEETHFNRADFVGIIKDSEMPEWAREKLEEINAAGQEHDNNMSLE